MKLRFRRWASVGIGALALALAGCGASNAATGASSSSGIAPGLNTKSITLVGAVQAEPNNWSPFVSTSTCSTLNFSVGGQAYVPLVWIAKNDSINYSTGYGIAQSITPSNNNTTWTIKLNPVWRWSNGQPVTAQDVVFDWDVLNASTSSSAPWTTCGIGIGGMGGGIVTSVTATGQYTVVMKTAKPEGAVWFEHNLIAQIIPAPKAVWDKYPNNMTQELQYIASLWNEPSNPVYKVIDGPYGYGTYVNNEYWTLVANPKFSGTPKPQIQKLVFEYDTSDQNVFAGLRKGTYATADIPDAYLPDKKQIEPAYRVTAAGFGFCFNYMVVNQDPANSPNGIGAAFDLQYVRQAMQMGIDQPAIIKDFYHGLAVPTYDPVPSVPKNSYYDPHITKITFNPAKGKQLLIAHGWKEVNGVMTKGSQKLQFTWLVLSGDTTTANIAQLIKQDWAAEGIDATIKELPFNQILTTTATTNKNWAAAWWGGGWCYEPDYYPSGDGLFNEPSFDGGYNNPKMNQLITASTEAKTPSQAQQTLNAYQEFAATNLPVLFIPSPGGVTAIKPGLNGVNRSFNPITVETWLNDWRVGKTAPNMP
jgi:peptide/nickel transport system substrate-binding protein